MTWFGKWMRVFFDFDDIWGTFVQNINWLEQQNHS